ncbi:MAG TPA: hypothetical protein VGG29_12165 [Caulobacteraceae bacterium]|jgi:hypothetical protein
MNRRSFVTVGACAVAVTATAASADILGQRPGLHGTPVRLSGRLSPAPRGPGHYFVFTPDRAGESLMVLPADAAAMRTGKVRLEGRLLRGKFKDETTAQAAAAVLIDARLV